ncbi:MAG: nucleotide exchange factor GrpE [Alphaproteobacteria bacterium]|nr:nucleotide exchange factor GrpE [Alphaproteobacteria bacterium]
MNANAKQKEQDTELVDENLEEVTQTNNEDETKEETTKQVNQLELDYLKLKDDYVRLYAEMENMKKRNSQETEKTIKFAVGSFAKELLGVADNLERAINAMKSASDECKGMLEGVKLTESELLRVFEKFGIKPFSHVGEKFDPNFERVVQEIEDKKTEPGTILSELQKGYTIHDRILREAMVIVSK